MGRRTADLMLTQSTFCLDSMRLVQTQFQSPIGAWILVASETGLCALRVANSDDARFDFENIETDTNPILDEATNQLTKYFDGTLREFSIPLDLRGTPFQLRVWAALHNIPYGQTRSYGEQAKSLGDVKLSRAVGAANGRNPISIIVPCHRIVGANGNLVGFAGGIERKQWLLDWERRNAIQSTLFDVS